MDAIKNPRIEAALQRALSTGETPELFDLLERASGLPGPRPNYELAQLVAVVIAAHGKRGTPLVEALLAAPDRDYLRVVATMAQAERAARGVDARRALQTLHDLAGDERNAVRQSVVEALRIVLRADGEATLTELARFTDGYLHAHVALEALADRTLLAALPAGEAVLARLDEAFRLADTSPRAAERSQGLRTLRRGLPAQIARFAARFPEVLTWLAERTSSKRPETREVVHEAIVALRRAHLPLAEMDRLMAALAASAPAPRDPTRIVQGTRRRSRGRR